MEPFTPISLNQSFCFSCACTVPCFNDCCQDLNQFLTPYDILRLKNKLSLNSGTFLERYTLMHNGPETGLPVVTLKPLPGPNKICPFVSEQGCTVYDSRPSSCRMYPLARMLSRDRNSGQLQEQYMLIREPHCLGFDHGSSIRVTDWLETQGIHEYNQINDLMMELISLKNMTRPGPLDIKTAHLFYTVCYDLDRFRGQVENGLLDELSLDSSEIQTMNNDDVTLLKTGLNWLKSSLFGT